MDANNTSEQQEAPGVNTGNNSTAKSNPTKRLRWATHRASPAAGIKKRQSILDRFHKRNPSERSGDTDATASEGSDGTAPAPADKDKTSGSALGPRTIYFNQPLPPEARDEDGHPKQRYVRNKIRTSRYTPLSFIPKDLWYQFHNIANVYFLFLILLAINPQFGAVNAGLNSAPLIIIVAITAIKDAIEDTRRTILDTELNNSPIHRLIDWENVNTSEDKVSVWRRIKKATSRFALSIWRLMLRSRTKKGKKGPIEAYAERATGETPGMEARRDSSYYERASLASDRDPAVEMSPLPSPRRSKDFDREQPPPSYTEGHLTVPGQKPRANPSAKRDNGNVIDYSKSTPEKARFKQDYWKNTQVGDFVRIYNGEEIPADIVVLSTSDPDGACYVETKNLDGETNLKVRQALRCGRRIKRARDCEKACFSIESEPPHANLYSFSAAARWTQKDPRNPDAEPQEMAEPVSINNLLLRGCSLRNTEWILGVVVFTGRETKIMLNAGITPSKRAKISRDLNWNVLYNFVILFFMCLIVALVNGTHWAKPDTSITFFEFGSYGSTAALNGFITFWAAIILFQNLVPISLYITLEIIRTLQAYFIYSDIGMYFEKLDYPCTPKSWNISDDLGQIEYIFSDKTGTLTQNVMEFKKATINGVPYGEAYTEAQAGMQKRLGVDVEKEAAQAREQINRDRTRMLAQLHEMHDNPYLVDDEVTFVAPDFVSDLAGQDGKAQATANGDFMLALALCHSVITERTPGNPPKIEFKAQSPDEAALVATARDCGFTVIGRTGDGIIVNVMGTEQEYTVLNTLEFNSSRKRMSAIVRMPDGKIVLYCKGADSIIYSRLARGEQPELRKSTAEHLEMFAREGLRTLCIARKFISEEEYREWSQEHEIAAAAVENREEKLEEVSDAIERDLTLLGGTAIEDRLQDGVPDAIELLGNAGIKLWVLTGDKVETAINIGFSCNLLNNDMDLILLRIEDENLDTAEAELDKSLQTFKMTGSDEELAAAKKDHRAPGPTHAVVIDGDTLKLVLDDRLKQKFLLLCKQCKSVLCCRVSPAQKAAVVRLVKHGLDVMTLSIGDGANDVAMIQEADVGVGIAGEEGRQAVMSSDFAVGQFRFLTRLMLVHGRWCYRRMGETIANFFYKNLVWTFTLFWYQIYDNGDCGYDFDYTYILLYNLAFTSLTIIFMGILDQDVSDKVSLAVPQLYRRGIERREWTPLKFWLYMLDGLYQSLVCFYMAYLLFQPATFNTETGLNINDQRRMGVFIANAAVIAVNTYFLLNTYRWDWLLLTIAAFSVLLVFFWTGVYGAFTSSSFLYQSAPQVYGSLAFWAMTLLTVCMCLAPRFAYEAWQKFYKPRDVDIIREQVVKGQFKYLDDQDTSKSSKSSGKKAFSSSSSGSSDPKAAAYAPREPSEDERPIYPPSVAPTQTTGRNPHSQQGSDDSTIPQPYQNRSSFDKPRISIDRPRPSFDRMRSSMDQLRPSFELSRDMSTASYLSQVESSRSQERRGPSNLR